MNLAARVALATLLASPVALTLGFGVVILTGTLSWGVGLVFWAVILVKLLDDAELAELAASQLKHTLLMFDAQLQWMNDNGGLDFAAGRSARSGGTGRRARNPWLGR